MPARRAGSARDPRLRGASMPEACHMRRQPADGLSSRPPSGLVPSRDQEPRVRAIGRRRNPCHGGCSSCHPSLCHRLCRPAPRRDRHLAPRCRRRDRHRGHRLGIPWSYASPEHPKPTERQRSCRAPLGMMRAPRSTRCETAPRDLANGPACRFSSRSVSSAVAPSRRARYSCCWAAGPSCERLQTGRRKPPSSSRSRHPRVSPVPDA